MKRYFMKSFKKEKDSSTLSSFRGSDSDRRILTKSLNDRKKGFTFLVKHFRSNPLTAMLRSCLSRFSQTKFRGAHTSHTLRMQAHSYGFTLAETLITLTILGIVAAITIPALINRQQEAANRTKLKKAMAVYEKALNTMIIENDLKTNQAIIDFGAEGGACANTTEYFKKVEGDGCRFKTADRIWWDITDIENPLIILKNKMKNYDVTELKTLAKDTNDVTTYGFVGKIDDTNGTIRINDSGFENVSGTDDTKAYMSKLYNFINNVKSGAAVAVDPYASYRDECTCSMQSLLMATQTFSSNDCKSCTAKITYQGADVEGVFNENGKVVYYKICPEGSQENCQSVTFNDDGSQTQISYYGNGNIMNKTTRYADGSVEEIAYYSNGNLSSKNKNNADGSYESTSYYENGNYSAKYKRNTDGSSESSSYYENGKLSSKNKRNADGSSESSSYYETGKIQQQDTYSANGVHERTTYSYYDNGQEEKVHKYNYTDSTWDDTDYYENGVISFKYTRDSNHVEKQTYYYESGKVKSENESNSQDTFGTDYYENGKVKKEWGNKPTFHTTTYSENGIKESTLVYNTDKTSEETSYYEDGKIKHITYRDSVGYVTCGKSYRPDGSLYSSNCND